MWLKTKTKTNIASRTGGVLMVLAALFAAGLAYGHARLSLANSSSLTGNYQLAALHLDASRWFEGRSARWHYRTARMLLNTAESDQVDGAVLRESAIVHLQTALGLSPMWSDAWTWLAVARLQQANTDDLFDVAFARSIALGPNEARNMTVLFPWALLQWRDLTISQQQQVFAMGDRSARRKPGWVVSTALRFGQLYSVCDRLETRVWAQRQCQQSGWTPTKRTEP
jgi:hypothetical protein